MITADFYPTTTTILGGNDDANYNTELTDVLTSLTPQQDDFARAYYLYYVPWELVPPVYKASCAHVNNNSISARCITPPQNVSATFVGAYSTSTLETVTRSYTADYSVSNGAIVRNTTSESSRNYRLYNNYSIRKNSANVGFIGQTSSGGFFAIVGINQETGASSYSLSYTSSPSSGDENIEKFLNGELYFTISRIGSSGGVDMFNTSFTIGVNDIDEETGYYHFEENGIDYYVGINAYTINSKRDVNTQNSVTNYTNPAPALRLFENDHYHLRAAISGWNSKAPSSSTAWYNGYVSINVSNQSFTVGYFTGDSDGASNYIVGDFNFDLSRDEFNKAPTYRLWVVNKTILYKSSATVLRAFRLYTPSEIIAHLRLYQRASLNNTYEFSDDYKIPKYTDTDSATTDFLVGDHETIGEFLRPWQDEYFKVSEFTPDDIPPYVPPGPTPPPEGEESGDRIPNNERYFSGAYNFITQYAMTRQQLGQFGNLLWTSWADQQGITDMWKNFKMFISSDPASDTGSIDIASVMDFILSLQVFPFDLSSLLHTDSANVCIGTGQYPLAVSGKKLLTINHILDCGTMAIPRPYNDFRDYENMSITAYLPYCGSVELNPGDVVGRSVSIEYSVDTLSGSCTAVLTAYDDEGYLYNVGMINGQISASIPMTATNSGQIRAQRISDVASLAGLAGNTFLGNISQGAQVASGADSNPIGAISSAVYGTVGRSLNAGLSAQQMFANRFSRGAISCPTLAGGNGIAAFYQPACPYIQMRYGLYQKPANYDHSVGEVSASSNPLSSYAGSGFTVCENVDISGFTCHEEERSAIKALLESGVYL